jgi:putative salt-induced outer membrane protein
MSSRFCLLLSIVPILFADQVVLKNGDTITGAIIKKDGAKLTIKSEFLGEVTMPWTAVKSLKSDDNLTVVLPSGESLLGKVNTTGDQLEVVTSATTKSTPLADVGAMRNAAEQHSFERTQHPGLLELWTGSYDMGLALARGNARTTTLTNSFAATRVSRKDKVTVNFNEIYANARLNGISNAIASAVRGGWTYNRDLTPKFFVSTLNTYEHDRFQSLDLRFVAGGGFGVNAVKTDKANLSFIGGGDYERENFTNNLKRNSAEANFGDDFLYKLSGSTSVTQSMRFFPNVTDTGEYRMTFDLTGVTVLKKWLAWHVTASNRFVSNPVFGLQRNDLLLSTGFRLTFAK